MRKSADIPLKSRWVLSHMSFHCSASMAQLQRFDSGWHHFHSLLFLLHISQCYQIFNLITAECDLCFTLDFLFLIFRYLQLISKLPWIKFLTWNLSVIMTSGPVAWGWGNASAGKWRNTVLCKNETLLIDSLLELVVLQIVLLLTLLSSTNVCHSIKERNKNK